MSKEGNSRALILFFRALTWKIKCLSMVPGFSLLIQPKKFFSFSFSKFCLKTWYFWVSTGTVVRGWRKPVAFSLRSCTENGRHWTLLRIQMYCLRQNKRAAYLGHWERGRFADGKEIGLVVRTGAQSFSDLHFIYKIIVQFVHSFSMHSFIHSSKGYWVPISCQVLCSWEVYWLDQELMK